MMMGTGNLTELTEVDSAGVNLLLAGICQELGINSVLTTEVINWARSSVKELDAARRLVRHSVKNSVLPKHVDSKLVMLRDARVQELSEEEVADLAARIQDANFRVLVEGGELHLLNRDGHWHGSDPYELFDSVLASSTEIDASHAFYLGYEISKAVTALTLGKQYTQDQPLNWGFLTVPENSAVERRRKERMGSRDING
jgi:dihydropteroate synthase